MKTVVCKLAGGGPFDGAAYELCMPSVLLQIRVEGSERMSEYRQIGTDADGLRYKFVGELLVGRTAGAAA